MTPSFLCLFFCSLKGSRHQSLSSLHSQSSFRSCSSAPDTAIDMQQRTMNAQQWREHVRVNCPKHRELFRKASAPFDIQASPCYPPSYVPHRQQRPIQYAPLHTQHPHQTHLSNGFGTIPRPKPFTTPRIKSVSFV